MLTGKENKTAIVPFQKDDMNLRTITLNEGAYFIATDVCNALGLKDASDAVKKLDASQKQKAPRVQLGMHPGQDVWLINESGLYTLLMRSDKPEAKPFQLWVTNEVLPAIRKNGNYSLVPASDASPKAIAGSVSEPQSIVVVRDLLLEVALRAKKGTAEYRLVKAVQSLLKEKEVSNG